MRSTPTIEATTSAPSHARSASHPKSARSVTLFCVMITDCFLAKLAPDWISKNHWPFSAGITRSGSNAIHVRAPAAHRALRLAQPANRLVLWSEDDSSHDFGGLAAACMRVERAEQLGCRE